MVSLLQKQATLNKLASLRKAAVAALLIKYAKSATPGTKDKPEKPATTPKKAPWYANPGVWLAGSGLGLGSLLLACPGMSPEERAEAQMRYAEEHKDDIDYLLDSRD